MKVNTKKIINEFNRIKELGFVKNTKPNHGDGTAGNTFETYLGVKENNLKDPDFEEFEVKTKKILSGSWTTLFSKKPDHPEDGDSYMRENWGIADSEYPKLKVFRTSLHANRWSLVYKKYKIKLAVNRKKEQVSIVLANLKEEVKDNEVFWNFSQIHEGIKKLKNTFIVNYDVKEEANIFYYKYTNAIVFLDYIGENNFIDLIENGTVRYDNRLGIYRTGEKKGNLHNHGGGFRINAKNLDKLFATKIEI